MKKLVTLAAMINLLVACDSNVLNDIKNAKIEGNNITWAAAVEKLSACKQGTQRWQLQKDNRQHHTVALFECELTNQAIASYNARLEENAARDATFTTQAPTEKMVSAKLSLSVVASQEGNKPLIKIYPQFNNNKKEDSAIIDKKIIGQILTNDLNPIEQILPDPPMVHKKFNNQSIFE